ncbi:MAG TPA: phosphoribosylglycinamide formyltransferase [Clostridia bacterium]|nr:phosphoribosylglycinamide formyltransferase [Clostridia bacterium]
MGKLSVGVLASGRGSNLQSMIDASKEGRLGARIAVVISDNSHAFALERARNADIPAIHIDPSAFQSRQEYEEAIVKELKKHRVGLVCLAGYMRLVGDAMLEEFPGRIMNIHPALLPAFPGLGAQKQALEHGVRFSGCTVHFVDGGMDTGPIIAQAVVQVLDTDTPERLADRILEQEHLIYPKAIELFAGGRIKIKGRRVKIL